MVHKRHEDEDRGVATARDSDGAASEVEVGSLGAESTVTAREETAVRDERDRERWAKLKRLKQTFHVKRRKAKGAAEVGN